MKRIHLKHFNERLDERANDRKEVIETFEQAIKLVKKKKIRPRKEKSHHPDHPEPVYKLLYESCIFVYVKKNWNYILITFYQKRPS